MSARAVSPGTLSLVIPAYNEEARIPGLLEALRSTCEPIVSAAGFRFMDAIVVDDGSTDRTAQMLEQARAADPWLRPIIGGSHRGKGAAVAMGIRASGGEFVLQADVDLSTPLDELAKLSNAIREGADIAIGSRDIEGSVVRGAPRHRTWLGSAFNLIVRRATGLPFRDTQCGFKLLRTADGRELLASQMCTGFSYDVELLLRAERAGLRIAEVPVVYNHDSRSRVRVVPASGRMLYDVLVLAYRLRRSPSSRPEVKGASATLSASRGAADDTHGDPNW